MNIRRLSRWFGLFICFLILISFQAVHAGEGTIEGVVKIFLKDNSIAYGDWIRVLLVRDKITLPETKGLSKLKKYARVDKVINAHMAFYKNVREKMSDAEYIVAITLTRPDGGFRFTEIASGQYYIVVTFPSMVAGYKVAWQLPAKVTPGETTLVELSNDNFALPTYCRDSR